MCAWRWSLSLCGERSTAERRGVIRGDAVVFFWGARWDVRDGGVVIFSAEGVVKVGEVQGMSADG